MSSIMRRRSGLIGLVLAVVVLIGVLLVLEVGVTSPLDPQDRAPIPLPRSPAHITPRQSANRHSPRATGWHVAPSFTDPFRKMLAATRGGDDREQLWRLPRGQLLRHELDVTPEIVELVGEVAR